jgi:spore coat polysaccharide biosynthesis protein SpsF
MILAVLQARFSSSRLPGKILKPVLGRPMLVRQIERVLRSDKIERLVVATSSAGNDDRVSEVCASLGITCHRGSLEDVLDRIYHASLPFAPERIVRLTGDCPLTDWQVIDRVIDFAIAGGYDYGSNTLKPTWPDGLDVEVVTFSALATAWRESTSPLDREHVTPFIYNHKDRFKLGNLQNDVDLSRLRWTVDTPADFAFVTRIYEALHPANPAFKTDDIVSYLSEHPDVVALNAGIERNEGYKNAFDKIAGRGQNG